MTQLEGVTGIHPESTGGPAHLVAEFARGLPNVLFQDGKLTGFIDLGFSGVDAVDFSSEMIRVGRSLDMGEHPKLNSRESMSKEHMGDSNVRAFDAKLSRILAGFADDEGVIQFQLQTRVVWGRPLA